MIDLNHLIGTWRLCYISPTSEFRKWNGGEVTVQFSNYDFMSLKCGKLEERFRIGKNTGSYALHRFVWKICILQRKLTIHYNRTNQREVFELSYVDQSAMIWKEPTKQLTLQFSRA